jgi:hypothetical protein
LKIEDIKRIADDYPDFKKIIDQHIHDIMQQKEKFIAYQIHINDLNPQDYTLCYNTRDDGSTQIWLEKKDLKIDKLIAVVEAAKAIAGYTYFNSTKFGYSFGRDFGLLKKALDELEGE